jgi:hypothetical protein
MLILWLTEKFQLLLTFFYTIRVIVYRSKPKGRPTAVAEQA